VNICLLYFSVHFVYALVIEVEEDFVVTQRKGTIAIFSRAFDMIDSSDHCIEHILF